MTTEYTCFECGGIVDNASWRCVECGCNYDYCEKLEEEETDDRLDNGLMGTGDN